MYFESIKTIKNIFYSTNLKEEFIQWTNCFIEDNIDLLYICENNLLKGIVSIGDIHRFYQGTNLDFKLNQDFSYVEKIDFEEAEKIFAKFKTINEVPVVEDGDFIGVIKNGKKRDIRDYDKNSKVLKRYLKIWDYTPFLVKEIKRWKEKACGIDLFIYQNINDIRPFLNERDLEKYNYKCDKINELNYDKHESGKLGGFFFDYEKVEYIYKNGYYFPQELHSENLNIQNGHRVTPNSPSNNNFHKVFLFGPCTVFGAYVDDFNTIQFNLQQIINLKDYPYEVVNCGLLGPEHAYIGMYLEKMTPGDKVILVLSAVQIGFIINNLEKEYTGDLSSIFADMKDPISCWLDVPSHCNGNVNKEIANRIWKDIKSSLDFKRFNNVERKAQQPYYISYDVHLYFKNYMQKHKLERQKGVIGSIVMNCNPFTKGHRYLIEQACKNVDLLYIFVVEEDKSYFKFEDRYQMVKIGTQDLLKVQVIPSGKIMISKDTFSQYFEKDIVKNVESMEYDVRIFGEIVAKKLGISNRFVGEEPIDCVTKKYNETLKEILPEYGINIIEMPRKEIEGKNEIISATKVREILSRGDFDNLSPYCTDSIIEYLKNIKM